MVHHFRFQMPAGADDQQVGRVISLLARRGVVFKLISGSFWYEVECWDSRTEEFKEIVRSLGCQLEPMESPEPDDAVGVPMGLATLVLRDQCFPRMVMAFAGPDSDEHLKQAVEIAQQAEARNLKPARKEGAILVLRFPLGIEIDPGSQYCILDRSYTRGEWTDNWRDEARRRKFEELCRPVATKP